MEQPLDVVVIGGGPAGLTAALYAARRGLTTTVITQDIGGQAATTGGVENYPGLDPIDGLALMMKFKSQAEQAGAKVIVDEVRAVDRSEQGFRVTSANHEFQSLVAILAYGLTHRHLGVPGEEKLIGKGVTFCATCDAPLYRNQAVAVVGGGNSAMDAALLLANFGATVALITNKPEFHGEQVLIDRIKAESRITVYPEAIVEEILGQGKVEGIAFHQAGQSQRLPVTGVFVEIGFTVKPDLIRGLVELDPRNQVIVHPGDNSTSVPGLFAAGDVTTIPQKQIVISAGEGAKAALGAYQYLQGLGRIKAGGLVDWGVSTPLRHEQPIT